MPFTITRQVIIKKSKAEEEPKAKYCEGNAEKKVEGFIGDKNSNNCKNRILDIRWNAFNEA